MMPQWRGGGAKVYSYYDTVVVWGVGRERRGYFSIVNYLAFRLHLFLQCARFLLMSNRRPIILFHTYTPLRNIDHSLSGSCLHVQVASSGSADKQAYVTCVPLPFTTKKVNARAFNFMTALAVMN